MAREAVGRGDGVGDASDTDGELIDAGLDPGAAPTEEAAVHVLPCGRSTAPRTTGPEAPGHPRPGAPAVGQQGEPGDDGPGARHGALASASGSTSVRRPSG